MVPVLRRPRAAGVVRSRHSAARAAAGARRHSLSASLLVVLGLGMIVGGTVGLACIMGRHSATDALLQGDSTAARMSGNGAAAARLHQKPGWTQLWKDRRSSKQMRYPQEIPMEDAFAFARGAAERAKRRWEEAEDRHALGLAQDPTFPESTQQPNHTQRPQRRRRRQSQDVWQELEFNDFKQRAASTDSQQEEVHATQDIHVDGEAEFVTGGSLGALTAQLPNGGAQKLADGLRVDSSVAAALDQAGKDFQASGIEGAYQDQPVHQATWQRPQQLRRDDIVMAIATHRATEPQLKAGRSARLGMRTYVATNYTESPNNTYPSIDSETWGFYPDDEPVRSFYPGDTRAALVPFLAYQALGESFKWLLYADDDTVPFVDAAITAVEDLDPEMPYFLTDNFWWSPNFGGAFHPNPEAPCCLPCGYSKNISALPQKLPVGCPCTPQAICSFQGGFPGTFGKSGKCGAPRTPARAYSMHGGAGALISVGLLRKVDWDTMERCINHQWNSGGDAFITLCLWEQGVAMTTPDPLWHPEGLNMFDPSPPPLNPDDFILHKAAHVLGNLLQAAANVCQGLCKLELQRTVTVHLRARRTGGSDQGAALFIRAFSRFYARLTGRLASTESTTEQAADDSGSSQQQKPDTEKLDSLSFGRDAGAGKNSRDSFAQQEDGIESAQVELQGQQGDVDRSQQELPDEDGSEGDAASEGDADSATV